MVTIDLRACGIFCDTLNSLAFVICLQNMAQPPPHRNPLIERCVHVELNRKETRGRVRAMSASGRNPRLPQTLSPLVQTGPGAAVFMTMSIFILKSMLALVFIRSGNAKSSKFYYFERPPKQASPRDSVTGNKKGEIEGEGEER